MPSALQAAAWGLLAGSALVLGAALGWWLNLPQRVIAGVMAFGSGVLLSALSFELMDKAWERGGFAATALGFVCGAAIYALANAWLVRRGARYRKRSGPQPRSEQERAGSGSAIALGALLDGVPESIVIGLSLLGGKGVSVAALVAIFVSNIPEGLSSAAGMKRNARGAGYVFGLWSAIACASALAAWLGYVVFGGYSQEVVAATTGLAAGAILVMLADTMIPEAFEQVHQATGPISVAGYLVGFALSKLAGE